MISRRESQGFPPNVMRQVFAADTAKLPAYVGIPIPDAGYMLLRVSKVVDEPAKEADPQPRCVLPVFMATRSTRPSSSLRSRGHRDQAGESDGEK